MTQKKSSNWYIAATHYLTAGFAIPFVIGLIVNAIIAAINLDLNPLSIITLIIKALAIWLGTIYSANYLKKAYIIDNKDRIINISLIYFIILNLGYMIFQIIFIMFTGMLWLDVIHSFIIYSLVQLVVVGAIFYLVSKKYVKNTETPAT
jgi:uncharacterized membrane protein